MKSIITTIQSIGSAATMTLAAGALCLGLLSGCGSATSAKTEEAAASGELQTSEVAASESGYASLGSFTAKTLDGKTFTQDDLAKADVTIVNYWATFCGYCIDEMPAIAEWAKTLPENVQVITVCADYDSDPKAAKEIMDTAGFEGVTLVSGTGDFESAVANVMYLPTTFALDGSGNVVGDPIVGAADDVAAEFAQLANDALAAQGKAALDA